MTKIKDTDYLYATARIRSIENRLLDRSKLDRMIDASSAMDALKVITEAEYAEGNVEIVDVFSYEKLLTEELKIVFDLLSDLSKNSDAIKLFRIKNDYHNIKTILKSEFLGSEEALPLIEAGTIQTSKLKEYLKERELRELSSSMRDAVEEVLDTFGRTQDPQIVDIIFDKACYSEMSDMAKTLNNSFVNQLIKHNIDIINIMMFIRVKNMKKGWDFLQKILLSGGNIDKGIFIDFIEGAIDGFVEKIKFTDVGACIEQGIESFKATNSLADLEKRFDNFIIKYIKAAKYKATGIEPLVAYLIAKESEMKNIRLIMTGKINNIPVEIIRERLRESYV